MADLIWPEDLRPASQTFYLQPHVGGTESPLTRVRKVYGLSAPRWIARMTFTTRSWGDGAPAIKAGRLEALIAEMEGGLNRVALWDFRRETSLVPQAIVTELVTAAASKGASQISISGFSPYSQAFAAGDYVGGDQRPHMIVEPTFAGSDGVATPRFRPPLSSNVPGGSAVISRVPGWFRLNSADAGANETGARERTTYVLELTEDLQ